MQVRKAVAPALAVLCAAAVCLTAQQPAGPPPSLSGLVVSPDWLPVAGGTIAVKSPFAQRVVTTDAAGRFHVEGLHPGAYDVIVSAPRLMQRRVMVAFPLTGSLVLPPVQLDRGSHVRMIVLAPGSAQPIEWPRIIFQPYELNGAPIPPPSGEWPAPRADRHGSIVLGPLPRGMLVLGLDTAPFARMRLGDVRVTGDPDVLDAGTVLAQTGAVLNVLVVDGSGRPVPDHEVHLQDPVIPSPFWSAPVRTGADGRATFERLASGRYHLRTAGSGPCGGGNWPPAIVRAVDIPPAGTVTRRLVIGGSARIVLVSQGAPVPSRSVALSPSAPPPGFPVWLRNPDQALPAFDDRRLDTFRGAPCFGVTGADGRATMPNVPPGPARVSVRIGTSTVSRRVTVPTDGREIPFHVATGLLPVRVLDGASGSPIPGAGITWISEGASVETSTSATGEALLNGVGEAPGTLVVEAPGYRRRTSKRPAPPAVLHDVALQPAAVPELRCRVVDESGAPLAGASVELAPHDPLQPSQVAAAGRDGIARFGSVPGTAVRVVARAARHAASAIEAPSFQHLPEDLPTVALPRGYRIEVRLAESIGADVFAVRVSSDAGAPVDALLDAASDRVIGAGGRIALGPLPRGSYVVELRSESKELKERVRIEEGDVRVTLPRR